MAALSRGLELLESAVGYALTAAAPVTPELLRRPTPCAEWDLERLLGHVGESIGVLCEALEDRGGPPRRATADPVGPAADPVGPAADPVGPAADPAGRLRREAIRLLEACATGGPSRRRVSVGDRELTVGMVAVTGALEICVHGWDVSVACGVGEPIPPRLAAVLLPLAPLFVSSSVRPGLFAAPVRLPNPGCRPDPVCPGDRLVAFLGRRPRDDSRARDWSA